MHRWLALLGVVMLLSVSADKLAHHHGLGDHSNTCLSCQARSVVEAPPATACAAVPVLPEPIVETSPWRPPGSERGRYRLAPKTSPPSPVC